MYRGGPPAPTRASTREKGGVQGRSPLPKEIKGQQSQHKKKEVVRGTQPLEKREEKRCFGYIIYENMRGCGPNTATKIKRKRNKRKKKN